jgi:hypothetical protein
MQQSLQHMHVVITVMSATAYAQVLQPAGKTDKPWQYPTSFAVDWTSGSPGNRCVFVSVQFDGCCNSRHSHQ